ncbi:MAG: F0F1 ATP synthase subunit B [Kiritimatiellae bacterium]|nr:F0F1 ATP synthase subunit B [Kiritimatiellia bacterium]
MFEFSLLSFVFAVVNFLILVGLLYKFLHKPLLNLIEKRRVAIEQARREAAAEAEKARRAREDYERKLAAADEERDKVLSETRQSADAARRDLLEKAKGEAEREVANLKQTYERERREALSALEEEIAGVSVELAGRVLEKLVDTGVESKLHAQLLAELDALAGGDGQPKRPGAGGGGLPVRVVSARALEGAARQAIADRVRACTGGDTEPEFKADSALIAGTRVEFGDRAVDASLADVLAGVRERVAALGGREQQEQPEGVPAA